MRRLRSICAPEAAVLSCTPGGAHDPLPHARTLLPCPAAQAAEGEADGLSLTAFRAHLCSLGVAPPHGFVRGEAFHLGVYPPLGAAALEGGKRGADAAGRNGGRAQRREAAARPQRGPLCRGWLHEEA